jgi:hypothetical protein
VSRGRDGTYGQGHDADRGRAGADLDAPAGPIAGLSTPLRVRLDFDAETIDLMIERLRARKSVVMPRKVPVSM